MVLVEGPSKVRFKEFYDDVEQKQGLVYLPEGILGRCPGARPGEEVRMREPGSRASMYGDRLGSARKGDMGPSSCGPPPKGGAIEVWCYVDWVAVKGRGLGGPNPS